MHIPAKVMRIFDEDDLKSVDLDSLLLEGRAVLIGGTACIKGRTVYITHIQKNIIDEFKQVRDVALWLFCTNPPKRFSYHANQFWNDKRVAEKRSKFREPHISQVYVVAEVDPSLVEAKVNTQEMQEVLDWAMRIISEASRKGSTIY